MNWAPRTRRGLESDRILPRPPHSASLHARVTRTIVSRIFCQPITKSAKIRSLVSQITLKRGYPTWAGKVIHWLLEILVKFAIAVFLIVVSARYCTIAHALYFTKYQIVVFVLKRNDKSISSYLIIRFLYEVSRKDKFPKKLDKLVFLRNKGGGKGGECHQGPKGHTPSQRSK